MATIRKPTIMGALGAVSLLTLTTGLASAAPETQRSEGDLVRIPVGQQSGSAQASRLPRTGESRSSVLRRLGDPDHRRSAVGEPPISAWEYPEVVVYFEHDHVIHAVRRHEPAVKRAR